MGWETAARIEKIICTIHGKVSRERVGFPEAGRPELTLCDTRQEARGDAGGAGGRAP